MLKTLFVAALIAAPSSWASDLESYDNPGAVPPEAAAAIMKAAGPDDKSPMTDAETNGKLIELFLNGARTFEHAGKKYALKMAFSRAKPDPAVMGYKAGVRYQLAEYSDQGVVRYWQIFNPSLPATLSGSNPADGTKFRVDVGSKRVDVTMETDGKAKTYKFSISDLREAWRENAHMYDVRIAGSDWHFVPQMVWTKDGGINAYSWISVISGKEPLDKDTGLPLDAVRLCTGLDDFFCVGDNAIGSFAFSVATGLEIEQRTGSSQELTTKPMDSWTLHDLISDEVNDKNNCLHYNCEKSKYEIRFNNW